MKRRILGADMDFFFAESFPTLSVNNFLFVASASGLSLFLIETPAEFLL